MTFSFLVADRSTWNSDNQTVKGVRMILLGEKPSMRKNPKKTQYYFLREGTQEIYYRCGRGGMQFIPMARFPKNMTMYYKVFTGEVTSEDLAYLTMYNVTLYA